MGEEGVVGLGEGWGWGGGVEGVAEGSFYELAAVDFHGGEGSEVGGEFLGGEVACLFGCFALEEAGCDGGDGDGGLAAEGLEGGAVDDALAVFFGEFEPEAHHVATFGGADGSYGVGIFHFALVLGVGELGLDILVEVVHGGDQADFLRSAIMTPWMVSSSRGRRSGKWGFSARR